MNAHQSFGRTRTCYGFNKLETNTPRLARGYARSYGDVCLIDQGYIMNQIQYDKAISLDGNILKAQAGMSLAQVLEIAIPRGLFLEVSPGTKWVSLGGAIANDIHGKNHHFAGSFGCHVLSFDLKRSNGEVMTCSREKNSDMFFATLGGIGLTGTIQDVEFKLKQATACMDYAHRPFYSLDEYCELQQHYDPLHEYTVAWLDGTTPGRGIYIYGDHAQTTTQKVTPYPSIRLPFDFPHYILNPLSIRLFNELYFITNKNKNGIQSYDPFFYPLDVLQDWNRCYGSRGFFQHQCVIPKDRLRTLKKILSMASREVSFLIVLKAFGEKQSGGLLSFPKPGFTLAMDFANRGSRTLDLLKAIDLLVEEAGGRIYLAKDATMAPEFFQRSYPNIKKFQEFIDPHYRSEMSKRLGITSM